MKLPMKGWKTWMAMAGAVGAGLVHISNNEYMEAVNMFVVAFGLLGLGSKIEKN